MWIQSERGSLAEQLFEQFSCQPAAFRENALCLESRLSSLLCQITLETLEQSRKAGVAGTLPPTGQRLWPSEQKGSAAGKWRKHAWKWPEYSRESGINVYKLQESV